MISHLCEKIKEIIAYQGENWEKEKSRPPLSSVRKKRNDLDFCFSDAKKCVNKYLQNKVVGYISDMPSRMCIWRREASRMPFCTE